MNTENTENKKNFNIPTLDVIALDNTSIIVNSGNNGDTLSSDNGWNI